MPGGKMPTLICIVMFFCFLLAPMSSFGDVAPFPVDRKARAPIPKDTSEELNKEGEALFAQKKYEAAEEKFRQAVKVNSDNVKSLLNLAVVLCEYRRLGKTCEHKAFRRDIAALLMRASLLQSDPLPSRPELAPVADTMAYQIVYAGKTSKNKADIEKRILQSVTWWGPPKDSYGNSMMIRFNPDGSITGWKFVFSGEFPIHKPVEGAYKLDGDKIEIRQEKDGEFTSHPFKIEFDKTGILDIDGWMKFKDEPNECGQ